MTAELVRHASRMSLVDLNAAAIKVCRERFGRLPTPIEFVVNDGQSLAGITGTDFDFIACYDSMVHMHPDVIRGYVVPDARVDVGPGNGVARPQRTRPTRRRFAYRDDG